MTSPKTKGMLTAPPRQEPTITRCLFIAWNDGTSTQFTVPDDYRLSQRSLEDGRPLPRRLEVFDELHHAEVYLDVTQIRSAYVLDIAADRVVTAGALG